MPPVAEPDVAVVRPADNEVPVGRSVFVRVRVEVETPIDVSVASAAAVVSACMMPTAVVSSCMVPTAVMATLVPAMAATFRIRRCNDSNPERRSDRKNERDLLQHFCSQSEKSQRTLSIAL